MQNKFFSITLLLIILYHFGLSISVAEIIKKIEIIGNERISSETIKMFSEVNIEDNLNKEDTNQIIKKLYKTNYFKTIEVSLNSNILKILVKENPIIEEVIFKGIKADKIKNAISKNLSLKSRTSFTENLLAEDKENIINSLKNLGYYFSSIDVLLTNLDDNKITLTYEVDVGEKSKIQKIFYWR